MSEPDSNKQQNVSPFPDVARYIRHETFILCSCKHLWR